MLKLPRHGVYDILKVKPGAHTAILVGRFRFRWMFSAKTISDRICGLIYIATFANIIHLNLNRPTKIAVCAPGLKSHKNVGVTELVKKI